MGGFYWNGVPVDKDKFAENLVAAEAGMVAEQESITTQYPGVGIDTAGKISYLRTRSRWTPEKEAALVAWDRAGLPTPEVINGDF